MENNTNLETATLGNGCFWCTEAIFKRLIGILEVASGYAGRNTNHAEALQIIFDPSIISYQKLLDVFWATHNPTTLNRQGNDVGTQYRSVIFYHSEEQKNKAEESKKKLEKEGVYKDKIVTEIVPFTNFYKAEEHHQNYFDKNKEYPYCRFVIYPKIQKLLKEFGTEVKEEFTQDNP